MRILLVLLLGAALVTSCGVTQTTSSESTTTVNDHESLPESDPATRIVSSIGHDITPLGAETIKDLTKDLDPLELQVTCMSGTERAFTGVLWNNKSDGLYLCKVCGLPLFESGTKFDSGTGWPSFFRPAADDHIVEIEDRSHGMLRVEVRCARSGTHLGHVFPDGPPPTHRRYCINSASLDFVREGDPLPPRSRPLEDR